jgi:hypothetical protein
MFLAYTRKKERAVFGRLRSGGSQFEASPTPK